ncbi:hypothetical protein F4604DRAFT_1685768 [Suillus subluteus]|nr:hypothetical protein F4604DRAFT_1685768 [Suillus subluteus]
MVVHQKTEVTIHDKYYRELSIWKQLSASYRTYMHQMVGLLECGIGIWPTQLPRYAEVVMLTDDEIEDTLIPTKEIYYSSSVAFVPANYRPPMIRDWQELVHPLGVYPAIFMGEERFQYYYVVPDHQIIAWLEDMDGHILFGECVNPSKWRHKRLELEAQYWRVVDLRHYLIKMNSLDCRSPLHRKHFEFFPHNFRMNTSQNNRFKNRSSDFKSIRRRFNVLDVRPDESSCRSTGQYQYASLHSPTSFIGNAAAVVLCVPVTIEHIQTTSVDGIVNGVEVRRFVNDFSSQAKSQITLAYYLRKKKMMLIIITCIPTFFCVLRLVSVGVGGPRVRKEQKVPQGAIPKA